MCNCHGHICQGRANPYAFYSPFLVIYSWLQHLFVRSRTSMHKRPWRQLTVFLDMYNIVSSTFVFQSQSLVSTLVFFFLHPFPPSPLNELCIAWPRELLFLTQARFISW
jgi:hypothetical protein